MKKNIYVADITHTAQGISAATFPLGASFIVSYNKHHLGRDFDFKLFKFPAELDAAIQKEPPLMLCFSSYSWNFELSYTIARLAKERDPKLIVVFGGPNFPTDVNEKKLFLAKRPAIDFFVELEGELGFRALIEKLSGASFDAAALKARGEAVINTSYLSEGRLISGLTERIKDIETIPSPYLTGILDEFFNHPLVPMLETTRGCPFSCTFCTDGLAIKNKVVRFGHERTKEELHYIARKLKNVDELIITDLNFAMYAEDTQTALAIAQVKEQYGWPKVLSASAGKNKPKRTIEVAGILKSSWTLGASIQSTDPEVLKAIKRSNISSDAYKELIAYGNSLEKSKTHSEIILGLPGDTKQKHIESLRFGVENGVNSMRMFQAMMLMGTEMSEPATRERHGLKTKFRTIPGCVGIYDLLGKKQGVSEIEEICVGSKDLPFDDYIECRVMNLIVETFYNNALFSEVFALLAALKTSVFDCLLYIKDHPERYTAQTKAIIDEFIKQTSVDLYDSYDEAKAYVLTPEIIEKYIGGELGINELLVHKALLFGRFEDISDLIFEAAAETLKAQDKLSPKVAEYLRELKAFTILCKKDAITKTGLVLTARFKYDFNKIKDAHYKIDPNQFPQSQRPLEFRFFHDEEQKRHIANQKRIYADTPTGLGRLIQRSNLKLFYRTFERLTETIASQ